jgi:hypothetical protein
MKNMLVSRSYNSVDDGWRSKRFGSVQFYELVGSCLGRVCLDLFFARIRVLGLFTRYGKVFDAAHHVFRDLCRVLFRNGLFVCARTGNWSLPYHESVRGNRIHDLVNGLDLPGHWAGLSTLINGRIYGPCSVGPSNRGGPSATGGFPDKKNKGESLA